MQVQVKGFFDERTATITYVAWNPESKDAVVIDPVLDYDPVGSKVWTESADMVRDFLKSNELTLHYILETHAHADHLSGAQTLQGYFPNAKIAISEKITAVQGIFKGVFNLPENFATDGSQFDLLLKDGEAIDAGAMSVKPIATPGHTPACTSFLIGDALFAGDAIFMPDVGTGRCDFPGGSAESLYSSLKEQVYSLPDETRIFVGHDYPPEGREASWETTVAAEKDANIQLKGETPKDDFLEFRGARDKSLKAPRLLYQSVQVNIDAGNLPPAASNEKQYLKIPVNVFPK